MEKSDLVCCNQYVYDVLVDYLRNIKRCDVLPFLRMLCSCSRSWNIDKGYIINNIFNTNLDDDLYYFYNELDDGRYFEVDPLSLSECANFIIRYYIDSYKYTHSRFWLYDLMNSFLLYSDKNKVDENLKKKLFNFSLVSMYLHLPLKRKEVKNETC